MLKTVKVKPLSANRAYSGRKHKSHEYKKYERDMLASLPDLKLPKKDHLQVKFIVYYSNPRADLDNFIKPLLDIMEKKYGFNDNRIYFLTAMKEIVAKGEEGVSFEIKALRKKRMSK